MNWIGIKHFSSREFDSPDLPGSGDNMQQDFINALDDLRERCGFPFKITSGYRTSEHNKEVEGKESSAHLSGWAADVACRTSRQRHKLLYWAFARGFKRIGISPTFVHLDMEPELPDQVTWVY